MGNLWTLISRVQDDTDATVVPVPPTSHQPDIEWSNCVIQERVRATYHRLTYKTLPCVMVAYLVMESAKKLNYFPPVNGISKYYGPCAIIHQEGLDYNKHCIIPFGEYMQAHDGPHPKHS